MSRHRKAGLAVLLALAAPAAAADLELKVPEIDAPLPLDPFDAAWAKFPALDVPLMAQAIAPPGGGGAVSKVKVQAVQCRREVFFRLEWADAAVDEYPSPAERYADAAALQFPAQPGTWPSPFMGDKDGAVAIWRWSASAQKDLDAGYQGSRAERQRTTADLYAFAGDATFRAGEAAGNILSQRRRESPVESLQARGFGTLTTTDDQPVKGKGVWRQGRWHVVLSRDLNGTPSLAKGSRLPFALAVWEGARKERDGMKSVSVWHTLALPGSGEPEKLAPEPAGHRVFRRYGCGTCHGREALGGVANPNAQTDPIPPLNQVKEGFTRDELKKVIFEGREPARKDPAGSPPPFKMNAWAQVMTAEEADRVVDWLFSLQPKGQEW